VRLSFQQLSVWEDPERLQMAEIDARDFGRLEAQVEALNGQVTQLSNDVKTLLELANKGKGGFWMGMTIASFMGGVITFVADRLWK
jgi:hypothetical protein